MSHTFEENMRRGSQMINMSICRRNIAWARDMSRSVKHWRKEGDTARADHCVTLRMWYMQMARTNCNYAKGTKL